MHGFQSWLAEAELQEHTSLSPCLSTARELLRCGRGVMDVLQGNWSSYSSVTHQHRSQPPCPASTCAR